MREFLDAVRGHGLVSGRLRGLFHTAIGRRVGLTNGTVLSTGITWRELAGLLKDLRFDKELVRELGANPEDLAPRDRQRFWYSAISLAQVNGRQAFAEAEQLAGLVKPLGYTIGPPPTGAGEAPPPPPPKPAKPPAGKKPPKKK